MLQLTHVVKMLLEELIAIHDVALHSTVADRAIIRSFLPMLMIQQETANPETFTGRRAPTARARQTSRSSCYWRSCGLTAADAAEGVDLEASSLAAAPEAAPEVDLDASSLASWRSFRLSHLPAAV